MKVQLNSIREFDAKTLAIMAGVCYWNDSEVNGKNDTDDGENAPCKKGDVWCIEIEIETGKILNWQQGITAKIHYKVCDQCAYELKDINGEVIISATNGYVPDMLSSGGQGFGDYIIMNIDENGQIDNWEFDVDQLEAMDY